MNDETKKKLETIFEKAIVHVNCWIKDSSKDLRSKIFGNLNSKLDAAVDSEINGFFTESDASIEALATQNIKLWIEKNLNVLPKLSKNQISELKNYYEKKLYLSAERLMQEKAMAEAQEMVNEYFKFKTNK